MKEKIRQLASGVVDGDVPRLELLQSNIEEMIALGQNYRGDIRIFSENQQEIRGLIYSDDSRVVLLQDSFAGVSALLPYEVRAELLDPGTVLEGHFDLVYNGGECRLPYRFEVSREGAEAGRQVETLQDFAELARRHPAEAQELFESREFAKLPLMEDRSVRAVCDGLHRALNRRSSLEEFLIGSGAKQRVTFTVDETPRKIVMQEKERTETIRITKSSWGQFVLTASSDNPCVTLPETRITQEDFDGDRLDLPFTIHRDAMHGGKNYARITLSAPLWQAAVELTLTDREELSRSGRRRWERRYEQLEFQKTWLDFLAEKGDRKENLEYLQYCWEEMTGDEEPDTRQKLYRAAISLWRGDADLADMILEDAEQELGDGSGGDTDAYCAYLYLKMQLTGSWERKEELLRILQKYRDRGEESVFLFLLMLAMDEGAADRPTEILERIRDFCRRGSRSPFLYLEACRIYNRHPDILKSLGGFELRTLGFGARHGILTEETALYLTSLVGKERSFRPSFLRLLTRLYETYERDEILGAVCAVLIRGDQRSEKNFVWFSRGVRRDIRLTRLYDYYLYTMPEDWEQPLPREIVLYFSYNSPHDPQSRLALYRNLLRFYDTDREIMQSYEGQIREYVRQEMMEGSVNAGLAELYRRTLTPADVDDAAARILPDILRTCEIRCGGSFTELIVVYGELEDELSVPVRNGVAYVPFYSPSCRVLFSDDSELRYAGVPYEKTELFPERGDLEARCYELCPRHVMLRLSECVRILTQEKKTENQIRLLKRELNVRRVHPQFKTAMIHEIVRCAVSREKPEEEEILTCIHYPGITPPERLELTRLLIELGKLDEAARQVRRLGCRQLPVPSLKKLAGQMIRDNPHEKDPLLLDLCLYLFEKGEGDDGVLEYLCVYYNSSSRQMRPILCTADARELDTSDMSERLLAQMLFTGWYEGMEEVFLICLKQGNMSRMLLHAYLVVKCDAYFLKEGPADRDVFDITEHLLLDDAEKDRVPEICSLALVKNCAGRETLTEEEKGLCRDLTDSFYRRGMSFSWMKDLARQIPLPEEIRLRQWIEYHGEPDQNLELCLRVLPQMEGKRELRLALPQVYPGIYVKSLLLFAGEKMSWKILRDGGPEILAQGSCRGEDSPEEDGSRFARLNRLAADAEEPADVLAWQQEVAGYARMETWVGELFTLPQE